MPEDAPNGANEIYGLLQETVTGLWVDLIGHIPFFIGGLLALVFFAILNKAAVFSVSRAMTGWKARRSLKDLLLRLMSIGIWVVGLLVTAMIIFPGLTPANALGALGVASIAIGLAFKDIFENFFAGILLLWKFPFENGDFIECQDIKGQVEDVTIRMTRIRLMSGEELLVPNAFLYKNPVRVITSRPYRRVSVMSGVAYGEKVAEAVKVIESAVRSCSTVRTDMDVHVLPKGFGSSSIDIEVLYFTDSRPLEVLKSKGEVVEAIKRNLDEAGIEIPFPYRTLTFKHPLQVRGAGGENES